MAKKKSTVDLSYKNVFNLIYLDCANATSKKTLTQNFPGTPRGIRSVDIKKQKWIRIYLYICADFHRSVSVPYLTLTDQ